MAFDPMSKMPQEQGLNIDPATAGWLLSILGGAAAPQKPGVQQLAQGGVAMAKGMQAAKLYKQQQDTQQSFAKILQQLLAHQLTPKGDASGLDAIAMDKDGGMTLKVPPMANAPTIGGIDAGASVPGQTSQLQPGFLARLFQE